MAARNTKDMSVRLAAIRDGFKAAREETTSSTAETRQRRAQPLSPERARALGRMEAIRLEVGGLALSARRAGKERGFETPSNRTLAAIRRMRNLFRESKGMNVEKAGAAQDLIERSVSSAHHTVKAEASHAPASSGLVKNVKEIVRIKERNEERVSRRHSGDTMRV